jgi:hypothetical protein
MNQPIPGTVMGTVEVPMTEYGLLVTRTQLMCDDRGHASGK